MRLTLLITILLLSSIISAQNVGINNNNPQEDLHISSDANKVSIRLDSKKSEQGVNYFTAEGTPSSLANVVVNASYNNWQDLTTSKVQNADDVVITSDVSGFLYPLNILRVNFNFVDIPTNATITNATLNLKWFSSNSSPAGLYSTNLNVYQSSTNALMLGFGSPTVKSSLNQIANIDYEEKFNNITPQMINNNDLYLHIGASKSIFNSTMNIDKVTLEIEYSLPAPNENVSWIAGVKNGKFNLLNGLNTEANSNFSIDENGITTLKGLKIPKNAGPGKVLTSNNDGRAFWADVPSPDQIVNWINKLDTAYYANGPVQINNNAPNPALIFSKGDSRLNNGVNMIETDNRMLNVIIDSNDDQTNEQFNIYKDSTEALTLNPTVRFNLGGNDSWINSGNLIIGSDVIPSTSATFDTLMFYDKMKGALRVGRITNSTAWAPSSIGTSSFATGEDNTASGLSSFATGRDNSAVGDNSFATGVSNLAIGDQSFVAGFSTIANNAYSTAIGLYNDTISANITNPTLFSVGNGTSSANRKNAMVVRLDGYIGLGNLNTPSHPIHHMNGARLTNAGVWTDASDKRLKSFINPIHYGLKEVMQLKPSSYVINSTGENQVGFIAQELKLVIPEVVNGIEGDMNKGETLGVSYGNMVALLTKAIQEQQVQIEELKNEITKLKEK